MDNQVDLATLPWAEAAIGSALLAYLLGCDEAELGSIASGEITLTAQQAEVATNLTVFRAVLPADLDESGAANALRGWITQLDEQGMSNARRMHEHVCGTQELPTGRDDIESALVAIAVDAYPAYLLTPDPERLPMMDPISFHASSAHFRHPQAKVFMAAVRDDPILKDVFAHGEPDDRYAMVYRNTGVGGGIQLTGLSRLLLGSAWRHLRAGDRTLARFLDQAIKQLEIARRVLAGKSSPAVAMFAFAGVLLPPNTRLDLGDGILRPATDADRELAPDVLKEKLQTTDSDGQTVFINYDGDVILECSFPYRVKVLSEVSHEPPTSWPEDLTLPPALEQAAMKLRFSLLLAIERESRVQIVGTWRNFDDPLNWTHHTSWTDSRQTTGLMPTQLTDAEVVTWCDWYKRLSTKPAKRIELALSRILRALSERREPSDVLIDSVIAWENLFGTKEGEPTLRVTMSLARLLEPAGEARKKLRASLRDIYTLRSDVVHGSVSLKPSDYPKCHEALEVAIRAIRVMATERRDILELPDGATRSNALLLE